MPRPAMLPPVPPPRRELSRAAAIAIVTGESIALGLVWCGLGLMAVCGALCYAELAVRFPESGGEYVYLRKGFGHNPIPALIGVLLILCGAPLRRLFHRQFKSVPQLASERI